jgi:hypothetical protein
MKDFYFIYILLLYVYIGVEKKLLKTLISGKKEWTRISKAQVKFVSDFLVYTKKYVPVEFPRKTRTLEVALQGVLPQNMYDHYMLFHVAIKKLTNLHHCKTNESYAESLLKKFAIALAFTEENYVHI